MEVLAMKIKNMMKNLLKDQSGEFGIKQIAATVAVIVIIGLIIGVVRGNIGTWVVEVWDMFIEMIKDTIS
jgi:Flp pilus assembly pilin Flp